MTTGRDTTFRANGEMNVTPFLDILLVLLVTFMAAVTGKRTTLDAQLAVPCPAACDGDASIVLEVGPGGEYLVNRRAIPAPELGRYLAGIYAGRPTKIIEVAGRPGAKYQDVATAIDVARGAGVQAVGLMGGPGGR